jgi:hypothetical protein
MNVRIVISTSTVYSSLIIILQGKFQETYPLPKGNLDVLVRHAASKMAKQELAWLFQTIDGLHKSKDAQNNYVKLVLYFDEAHVLPERKIADDPDQRDACGAMCWCFTNIRYFPFDKLQYKPGSPARSVRARENAVALQVPITEIPFDCFPKFPIKSHSLTLKDVSAVDFMAQFGRAL